MFKYEDFVYSKKRVVKHRAFKILFLVVKIMYQMPKCSTLERKSIAPTVKFLR